MGTFSFVGVGMLINLAIYIISYLIFKNSIKSAFITISAGFLCIGLAVLVGGWNGIGLAILGIGMLFFSILLYIYIIISSIIKGFRRNEQQNNGFR